MNRRVQGIGRIVSGALLNVAAVGGLICIVLVVLAFVFNTTLIMFKTGSMSPTIPAGSVSLVREIPAADIKVGDVVTVDRPGALPVTHRVTSVAEGASSAERTITMKGDANTADDPFPYTVDTVRIVLASVPNLAYTIVWMSNPWVLAVLTIGAATLVTWAFWPRGASVKETEVQEAPLPLPELPGNGSQLGLVVLIAPLAFGFALSGSAPAVTEVVTSGDHLTMISIGDTTAMAELAPGEPVQWQVGVMAAESVSGEVRIDLRGEGNTEMGLNASIRSCDRRWMSGICGGDAAEVHASGSVVLDGAKRQLTVMTTEEERWLLFDIWLPADGVTKTSDGMVRLQVHASGSGDEVASSPGPIGTLPPTGVNSLLPLWAAMGAIVMGLVLAGAAKYRRDRV